MHAALIPIDTANRNCLKFKRINDLFSQVWCPRENLRCGPNWVSVTFILLGKPCIWIKTVTMDKNTSYKLCNSVAKIYMVTTFNSGFWWYCIIDYVTYNDFGIHHLLHHIQLFWGQYHTIRLFFMVYTCMLSDQSNAVEVW